MENKGYIVISLGGSLIAPNQIDIDYLKKFTNLIKEYVSNGYKFAVITGGGSTARTYINASKEISNPTNDDLDWIGIATTRINAELLRVSFGELAHDVIIMNPDIIPITNKPVLVGGGWKPGNSSDLAAVHIAKSINAKKVINLSNIDYAYDKDPRKYEDATPIKESNWSDFRKILPVEWNPGLNSPFDPIAADKAEELGLEVAILNGQNIENLKNYLEVKEFVGTIIK